MTSDAMKYSCFLVPCVGKDQSVARTDVYDALLLQRCTRTGERWTVEGLQGVERVGHREARREPTTRQRQRECFRKEVRLEILDEEHTRRCIYDTATATFATWERGFGPSEVDVRKPSWRMTTSRSALCTGLERQAAKRLLATLLSTPT